MRTLSKLASVFVFYGILLPYATYNMFSNLIYQSLLCETSSTSKERLRFELDTSQKYGIIRDLRLPSVPHSRHDISLLVDLDTGKLQYAIDLVRAWEGPIHFVIYALTDKALEEVVLSIDIIRHCVSIAKQHAHWHLAFPNLARTKTLLQKNFMGEITINSTKPEMNINCGLESLSKLFAELQDMYSQSNTNPYTTNEHIQFFPSNMLWNVARRACITEFFIVIDADLLPSQHLRKNFIRFAEKLKIFDAPGSTDDNVSPLSSPACSMIEKERRNANYFSVLPYVGACRKRRFETCHDRDVYVIPTFQFNGNVDKMPRDTDNLLYDYILHKNIEPFYHGISNAYEQTNHELWINATEKWGHMWHNNMNCIYEAKWVEHYEPFFVARSSVPLMNEYFSGSAYTKISYVTETFAAKFRFKVMSNGFFVHRGKKSGLETEKMMELGALGRFFGFFLRDVKAKYNVTIQFNNRS